MAGLTHQSLAGCVKTQYGQCGGTHLEYQHSKGGGQPGLQNKDVALSPNTYKRKYSVHLVPPPPAPRVSRVTYSSNPGQARVL